MEPIDKVLAAYADNIPALAALAGSVVCDVSEAEDVLQDVLIKLLSNQELCKGIKNPLAFLRACVRNEAIDHVRKLGRAAPTPDEILIGMSEHASDAELIRVENLMWIRSYINTLSPEMQNAFISYALDGYSIAEVSKQLGIPQDTLRKRFNVIKRKIRKDRGG